jgi:hypothetical protein
LSLNNFWWYFLVQLTGRVKQIVLFGTFLEMGSYASADENNNIFKEV